MLILIPILIVVIAILIGLAAQRGSSKYAVEQRLEQIRQVDALTDEEELSKPFFQRVILPMGDSVTNLMRRFVPAGSSDNMHKRLVRAGLYPRVTSAQATGLSCLCAAGGFMLMLSLLVSFTGKEHRIQLNDPNNILYLAVGLISGYMIPGFWISKRIQERQEAILLAMPYTIDILMISVEAGMGFDQAMGYVVKKIKGPLAEEFSKTLNEVRLGKARLDALEDLGNRTGVEELETFVTAVVHSTRLGASIVNTLRIQAESIRVRRRQRAQEKAMKAPVKMVFPLVLFIFPALFIVILGPAGIGLYENLMR